MEGNLSIYENGDPYLIKNDALLTKIIYLCINVQSNLHEIIGNLNIRFQFYLSKDERYLKLNSEKPLKSSLSKYIKGSKGFIEEFFIWRFKTRFGFRADVIYIRY